MTYVCRACLCVCRPPSRFSACVHHPIVRTLAYTYHSSRLSACVCVCRRRRACVYVCAWRCASSSVFMSPLHGTRARTMHVARAPKSLHVRVSMPNIGVTQCPVRQSSKYFRETPRMLQHARRRCGAPFDDDGCRPSVLYLPITTHIYYIPRPRIPARLPASATNPDDYVTDHQIWLGLLLVCDGRHCLFPLARS